MWHRECDGREGSEGAVGPRVGVDPSILEPSCRRAYYRVAGLLPIRLIPLSSDVIEAAVFDLSLPDLLLQPIEEAEDSAPLIARLRRIEEKLDLLLGASPVDTPRQLSGVDRQSIVFSGSGLSLDVTWSFRKGDAYRVEILLPSPYTRAVRAVAFAVEDAKPEFVGEALRPLAIELRHMEGDDRDALIAFSYDLQRVALRARVDQGVKEGIEEGVED